MIKVESVRHTYGSNKELRFADWEINTGENWLLLGESGSGKTTLIHILAGILKPGKGKVSINGTSLFDLSLKDLDHFRGGNIGVVFQRPHIIKSLTIKENLLIAQYFAKLPEDPARISDVLRSLDIYGKLNSYPHELSQGQLQRVSIARAVVNKPALLIADEPTSSLDDKNTLAVLKLLQEQSALNQSTLIVATHDKRVKDVFARQYIIEG